MELQTVYPFRLPRGYVDNSGTLHREGRMRLATAGDELSAMRDPRVKADDSYMAVTVLAKVITSLGTLDSVTVEVIEHMFILDVEFLQNMYETINKVEHPQIEITCPCCGKVFKDTINFQGAG